MVGCKHYFKNLFPLSGYKNGKYNAKMRSTTAELKNFMLADAPENMALERNMLDGYQRISDSVIIGESPNKGSGHKIKVYIKIFITRKYMLKKIKCVLKWTVMVNQSYKF